MNYYVGTFEDGKPFLYSDEDLERMRKEKDETTVSKILNAFNSGKARKTDNKELAEKAYKPMQDAWNNKVIEDANKNKVEPSIDLNKIKSDARNKFKLPNSFTSLQEYNKFMDALQAEINSVNNQKGTLKTDLEKKQAQATLNELDAIYNEAKQLGKSSNIQEIKETAEANDDPVNSPEAGAARIRNVVNKLYNHEPLTADDAATLKANGVDIAAKVAELTGEDEKELLKSWGLTDEPTPDPEYKTAEHVTDTSKVTDIIGEGDREAPSLFKKGKNNGGEGNGEGNDGDGNNNTTTPPSQPDNNNGTTTGNNNMGNNNNNNNGDGGKKNKFWDSYKSGAMNGYPILKSVADIISNNARMNLDRAALLTGGQRDLDAYKPIETETDKIRDKQIDERAQFGGITKAEALEAAKNGDWDGVRKIAGMGGFSDQELSMFSGMNLPDDLQKLWGNKMRKDNAETEQTELKTEKDKLEIRESFEKLIDIKQEQIDRNTDLIKKLSGVDYEAIAEAANALKGVYGQIATYTSGGGEADTKTKNPFSLALSIMGQGGNMMFGEATGKTTSTSSQSTVDELIQQHLPEIIEAANKHEKVKTEVNNQIIELLQERNTELEDEIKALRKKENEVLGEGKNTSGDKFDYSYKKNETAETTNNTTSGEGGKAE